MDASSRQSRSDSSGKAPLLAARNTLGDELLVESDAGKPMAVHSVVATDRQGSSLTLLEEYALRKQQRIAPTELGFSFFCAAASLAFAVLIYIKTY